VVGGSVRTPFPRTRRLVRGVGPLTARIILVGEAPGRDEVHYGAPFVGQAGQLQDRYGWAPNGIHRGEVRIENVVEERPDSNRIESLQPRTAEWWVASLHARLDRLIDHQPEGRVIVPVGNLALNACLRNPLPVYGRGPKTGQWRTRQPGGIVWPARISQYRGSYLTYTTRSGMDVRMIPTVHPAAFLYADSGAVARFETWQEDWQRIARELDAGCPPLVEGTDHIAEHVAHCRRFAADAAEAAVMAVDLETAAEQILIAGFAIFPNVSFVLPLVNQDGSRNHWAWFWFGKLLALPVAKVFHNGLFDTYLLRWHKLPVVNWRWDTLGEHHLMDPSDRHTLAYCASRDLRTTFWKEESKEVEVGPRGGLKRKMAQLPQLQRYCGKDARNTRALHGIYRQRLSDRGLLPLYRQHYRDVFHAALDLSLEGFTVDDGERDRLHQDAMSRLEGLRHRITEAAGTELTTGPKILKSGKPSRAKNQPKGGLSNPRLLAYFYDHLKLQAYRKGGKRTANEVAVRRLSLKYPKKAAAVGGLVLEFRHWEKISQFTAQARLDRDSRMRSLYRPLTETGRLRSQTPPTGVGTNLQNQPHKIRSMFVPSKPDHILAELDLSQAESRIVDGSSGNRRAMELARTPPGELDQHRLMASEVLGIPMDDVSPRDRNVVGKRGRHATNYGMEGVRFSEVLIVETESEVVLTPDECQAIIDKVMKARPYIGVWQEWVRSRIIRERRLVNSWGRFLRFPQRILGKEDWKEGYAFGPQSEVGVLLTQEGWLPVWREIRKRRMQTRVVHQGHDSFTLDGPLREVWDLVQHAISGLAAEREYPGVKGPWTLEMPVGLKIGTRWGSGMEKEWKNATEVSWVEFRSAGSALATNGRGGAVAL